MADVKLSPLDQLEHDITEALGQLRGARAGHEHCPSGENEELVELCEMRLNRLLERRHAASLVR